MIRNDWIRGWNDEQRRCGQESKERIRWLNEKSICWKNRKARIRRINRNQGPMACLVCGNPVEVSDGYQITTCPICGSDMTPDMVMVVWSMQDEILIKFENDVYRAVQEIENTRTKNRANIFSWLVIIWAITLIAWWLKWNPYGLKETFRNIEALYVLKIYVLLALTA